MRLVDETTGVIGMCGRSNFVDKILSGRYKLNYLLLYYIKNMSDIACRHRVELTSMLGWTLLKVMPDASITLVNIAVQVLRQWNRTPPRAGTIHVVFRQCKSHVFNCKLQFIFFIICDGANYMPLFCYKKHTSKTLQNNYIRCTYMG